MDVLALVDAANAAGNVMTRLHNFLIYGNSKEGKTWLMATAIKIKQLKRIYWFDTENGIETIINMYNQGVLSREELAKVILIKIPDTRESPIAIETMLKAICTKQAVKICEAHGRVDCAECAKNNAPTIPFDYKSLTNEDAIFIDSLSQVGTSSLAAATLGKPVTYKPLLDDYGASGKYLSDLLTTIQACAYCHIFAVTHILPVTDKNERETYYPLCGTKQVSMNCAKYFGNVIFVQKQLKKHRAVSSSLANTATIAGSRLGLMLDKMDKPDLSVLLQDEGFFESGSTTEPADSTTAAPAEKPKPAFLTRK